MSTASIVAIKNDQKDGSGWVKAERNRLVTRITRVIAEPSTSRTRPGCYWPHQGSNPPDGRPKADYQAQIQPVLSLSQGLTITREGE